MLPNRPTRNAGTKGVTQPFVPAFICGNGHCGKAVRSDMAKPILTLRSASDMSGSAIADTLLHGPFPPCGPPSKLIKVHLIVTFKTTQKRRVSNPLWKAYSSYFSEQLFCSVSLFTSSGACHYGWPALCQWFAAPVPAAPAESPPPASPGTYSGNSRSRWQSCPGRRRR